MCWLGVWYYLEDETDPLTLLVYHSWKFGRQAWRDGEFGLHPLDNLWVMKGVVGKAGEAVSQRMDRLWGN